MRQGQQNRRGRGRNRKGQSPLTRSFESTGPDVKIRGTPSHIAEKYMALARDASSSGDPVLAENYLQHAEHYNRIIMAFRDQQLSQGGGEGMNGGMPRNRFGDPMEPGDEFGDDDGDEGDTQPMPATRQHEHQQPRFDNQRGGDQNRYRDRNDRNDRHDRHDRPDRSDHRQQGGGDPRGPSQPRPQVAEAGGDAPAGQANGPDFRRRERFPQAQAHEQPEFLRRPVRRPRREGNGAPGDANGSVTDDNDRD
jgi:hypothetical protein